MGVHCGATPCPTPSRRAAHAHSALRPRIAHVCNQKRKSKV